MDRPFCENSTKISRIQEDMVQIRHKSLKMGICVPAHILVVMCSTFILIVNRIYHIKAQRLTWFDLLHRILEDRMVKKSIEVETDVNTTTRETKEQMGK